MGIKYDEKSCGIVVYRKEKNDILFLLLHYPSGHWDFAKGHIEEGEEEKETAKRELIEETGIEDIKIHDDFREQITYFYKNKGKLSHKQVVFFIGETKAEKIKLSHEHQNFLWLPYEKAYEKLTFENAKILLKKAKDYAL